MKRFYILIFIPILLLFMAILIGVAQYNQTGMIWGMLYIPLVVFCIAYVIFISNKWDDI